MVYPKHQPAGSSSNTSIVLLPDGEWARYLVHALRAARQSVKLSTFLASHRWASAPKSGINLLNELQDVASRGIQCRAILAQVNTRLTPDTPNVGAVKKLQEAQWLVRMARGRLLHEKVIIIDKSLVLVGSHNISGNSVYRNNEMSVAIRDPMIADQATQVWWSRWNAAINANQAIEDIVTYGTRKSARTTARTGGDVLKTAGLSKPRRIK